MADETQTLELIVKITADSDADLKRIIGTVTKLDRTTKKVTGLDKLKKGFNDLKKDIGPALVVIAAAAVAIKKAYDFAKQGAALDAIRDKYHNVTTAMGIDGEKMFKTLQNVTEGLVSDTDLYSTALDVLGLGLVKTESDAVRLTRLVAQLGFDTNELTLALANQSKRRFDQLGLSLAGFNDRLEELKATGLSTEDAFTEAFLRQAEAQLLLVGDAAERDTAEFEKFEVRIADFFDTLKRGTKEAILPLIESSNDYAENLEKLQRLLTLGIISEEEYFSIITRVDSQLTTLSAETGKYSSELTTAEGVIAGYNQLLEDSALITDGAAMSTRDYKGDLKELQSLIGGKLGPSIEDFNEQQAETQVEIDAILAKIDEFNAKNIITPAQQAEVDALRLKYRDAIARTRELNALEYLTPKQEKELERLDDKFGKAFDRIGTLQNLEYLTPSQQKELDTLQEEYGDLTADFEENARVHEEATKRILFGLLTQRALLGEFTDAEFIGLTKIAVAWGIVDEATADATIAFDDALVQLEDEGLPGIFNFTTAINEHKKAVQGSSDATLSLANKTSQATEEMAGAPQARILELTLAVGDLGTEAENAAGTYKIEFEVTTKGEIPATPGKGDPPVPLFAGGGVNPGGRYTVGEFGAERFNPTTAGTIVTHEKAVHNHFAPSYSISSRGAWGADQTLRLQAQNRLLYGS